MKRPIRRNFVLHKKSSNFRDEIRKMANFRSDLMERERNFSQIKEISWMASAYRSWNIVDKLMMKLRVVYKLQRNRLGMDACETT